jgi:hypothetical protein
MWEFKVLSIRLGLSREKIWREKLFLGLVQNEINLFALLSFCTKPEKVSFANFFPETNQVESTIRRRERRFFQIFSYAKNTLLSIPLALAIGKSGRTKKFLVLVQIQNHLCAVLSICTKPGKIFSRPDFSRGPKLVESTMLVCFCLFLGKTWFKRLQKDFWKSPITALGLKSGLQ